jgi:hypothetical protein
LKNGSYRVCSWLVWEISGKDTKDGLVLRDSFWKCLDVGKTMEIRVDCYSGYRGEETPRRFWLEETLIEVKEVIDRWLDPEHRYFKVLGHDNSTYILRHDSIAFVSK